MKQLPSDDELIAANQQASADFAQWAEQAWKPDAYKLFATDPDQWSSYRDGRRAGVTRQGAAVRLQGDEPWRKIMLSETSSSGTTPQRLQIAWQVGYRDGLAEPPMSETAYDTARQRSTDRLDQMRQAATQQL